MPNGLQLDNAREAARIIAFIREQVGAAGYARVILGLSGGIDSALVASLCAEALGPEEVIGLLLPHARSNPSSARDAEAQAQALGIALECFEITPMVDPLVAHDPQMDSVRLGNIMSRCRMIALYDHAAARDALVAGTSNLTEWLLGYFTLFGDAAAAFRPIAHLFKCQVNSLSRHMGVVHDILRKAPSADLWEGQTDEGELGFTYDEADGILYLATERHLAADEIAARGYARDTIDRVLRRMRATAFKRSDIPALTAEERAVQ